MKLVNKEDPVLRQQTQKFDFSNPSFDPIEFSQQLVKTMIDSGGIGLAANQIGVPYSIFAVFSQPQNIVLFNPRIVDVSTELVELDEGCLTYPGLFVPIKRPRHVRVRYQQPNGETVTEKYTGMTARVILHELDHLNGEIFYNKANRYHREKALRKWRRTL